jgi:hypothetical protein
MLCYPLSFYATEGFISLKAKKIHSLLASLTFVTLTMGFMIMPSEYPFPYFSVPQYRFYFPSSMLQNSASLSDSRDVVNALLWLKDRMHGDAVLLTHRAFHGWALLLLNDNQILPYGYEVPEKAAEKAVRSGYFQIYLIWWVNDCGWHGQSTVSASFKEIFRSNKIAVYLYQTSIT